MATIRKLPSGKWNVQIRHQGKIFASATFVSLARAESWATEKGRELQCDHPLFLDAGHLYCHQVLANRPSQALTTNRIDRICKHKPMQKPMNEITLQDVNAYKKTRLASVSPTTCRDELLMIRRVFRWYINERLATDGLTIQNPCALLSVPKPGKPRDRVISDKELCQLLAAMSPQMAVIVELAFETAMRRSEILRLRPKDLHLDDRYLCVLDGKEGNRDVPLTTRAVALLQGAISPLNDSECRIFDVAAYSVSQALRRARESLGMEASIKFHQLRHTRITAVARKGFNQAQIMIVSGHRDIRSVQRYTHLNVQDVVKLLD